MELRKNLETGEDEIPRERGNGVAAEMYQNPFLKRTFRPFLRKLGIEVPQGNGFHAFRHANVSMMNSFGASHKLKQQRVGHAAGSPITNDIYTHVIGEDAKRVPAQLGDAVWRINAVNGRENENGLEGRTSKPSSQLEEWLRG